MPKKIARKIFFLVGLILGMTLTNQLYAAANGASCTSDTDCDSTYCGGTYMGGRVCAASGSGSGGDVCSSDSQCSTSTCVYGTCSSENCTNGTDDDSDSSIDCADMMSCGASPSCTNLANGAYCNMGYQCASGTCTSGLCASGGGGGENCSNWSDDDSDSTIDCADSDCSTDPSCTNLAEGNYCSTGTQCASGTCSFGMCTAASSDNCGDSTCSSIDFETSSNCPSDCYCGNGTCDSGETSYACSSDCGGSSDCSTDSDCSPGYSCQYGYCMLDMGGDSGFSTSIYLTLTVDGHPATSCSSVYCSLYSSTYMPEETQPSEGVCQIDVNTYGSFTCYAMMGSSSENESTTVVVELSDDGIPVTGAMAFSSDGSSGPDTGTVNCDTPSTVQVTVTANDTPVTSGLYVYCYSPMGGYGDASSTDGTAYEVEVCSSGQYSCYAYTSDPSSSIYSGWPYCETTISQAGDTVSCEMEFTGVRDKSLTVTVTDGTSPITDGIRVSCYGIDMLDCSSFTEAGICTMNASAGDYHCMAYCEDHMNCSYGESEPVSVSIGDDEESASATLTMEAKDKTISVSVVTMDGSPVSDDLTVYAQKQGGNWAYNWTDTAAEDGSYKLAVTEGHYTVGFYCAESDCSIAGDGMTTVDVSESDTTVPVTLKGIAADATLLIFVTAGGDAVPNAWVNVYSYNVSTGLDSEAVALRTELKKMEEDGSGAAFESKDVQSMVISKGCQTDENGSCDMMVPAGTYSVSVYPSPDQPNFAPTTTKAIATADSTTTVTVEMAEKSATIGGTVSDSSGNPVEGAWISCWSHNGDWCGTQSDETGVFSCPAVEGWKYMCDATYWSDSSSGGSGGSSSSDSSGTTDVSSATALTIRSVASKAATSASSSESEDSSSGSASGSTLCGYTSEGVQTVIASSEGDSVDFTFPRCDCLVTFTTTDSDGTLVPVSGGVNGSPSDYSYWVWGQIANGAGSMRVQSGEELTFSAFLWDENYVNEGDETATCSSGSTSVNFTMLPLNASISGSYVDGSGAPVSVTGSYLNVFAMMGSSFRSCEAGDEGYSCNVSAGTWCLGYWVDPSSGYASSSPGSSSQCVTIADSESSSQDLTLLRTGTINVTAQNPDGTGRENVWVNAAPYSATEYGSNDYQHLYMENGCITGGDGTCSIPVGASTEGVIYYLNAYIPNELKESESLMNPPEVSVTVTEGASVDAAPMVFLEPDGSATLQLTFTDSAAALTIRKSIINADASTASPVSNAKVDCFSPSGGFFHTTADENGLATCPCTTADTWKAAGYSDDTGTIYMSEVTDVTCSASSGTTTSLALIEVADLPEPVTQTNSDPAENSTSLDSEDGASAFFPPSCLATSGSVSCTMTPVVTPLTATLRPASFYGYNIECQDGNGTAIVNLACDATICVPVNAEQTANTGSDINDVSFSYYDDSTGGYSSLSSATVDTNNNVICAQVDHLTEFSVVSNTNLAGLTAEGVGDDGNEVADTGDSGTGDDAGTGASAASGGCGCRMGGEPSTAEQAAWPVMLLAMAGLYGLIKRSRRAALRR